MTSRKNAELAVQQYLATRAADIVTHLASLPGVHDVAPCVVVIRGGHYPAARYKQTSKLDPSCRAYREGQREATREMVYCVGNLPAVKRRRNVAFTVSADAREWYVAGYYPAMPKGGLPQPAAPRTEFHPFGNSFLLAPWDLPDAIDRYERAPYLRVPMAINGEG